MISIYSISNVCAKHLANKVPNTDYPTVEDQISVYAYGFQFILGAIWKGVLLVSLALLFDVLVPALIVTITFSSFRIIAGGYHMKTYLSCITVSLVQFIGSAIIIKNLGLYNFGLELFLTILCILTTMYAIIKHIPNDNQNRPITKQSERLRFKKWSFIYLVIWVVIMYFASTYNQNLIVVSSCIGLLLEIFSILKIGSKVYLFFDR